MTNNNAANHHHHLGVPNTAIVVDTRDGRRAMLVLVGSFFAGMLSLGNALSLGVLFPDVAAVIPAASTPAINMIFALTASLTYMGGTATPFVINHIGYRYTVFVGGLAACIGYVGAAFSSQIWHLYLSLGLVTGLGYGFIFTPAVGIVGLHFNKYKHFAGTTATTGVPLGIMAFSMFHHHVAHAAGFRVVMLANAAVCLLLLLCAFAIKNPTVIEPPILATVTEQHGAPKRSCKKRRESVIDLVRHYMLVLLFRIQPQKTRASSPANLHAMQNVVTSAVQSSSNSIDQDEQHNKPVPVRVMNLSRANSKISTSSSEKKRVTTISAQIDNVEQPMKLLQQQRALICEPKMWCLLVEGLSMLAVNIYLLITPVYLVQTFGWTKAHAALVVLTHGGASMVFRPLVVLLNAFPRIGDRISKTLQAGVGIVCIFICSVAFFFSIYLAEPMQAVVKANATVIHSKHNLTSNLENYAEPQYLPPLHLHHHKGIFEETNALYFFGFAFVNGAGNTFFLAYQPSIVLEVLGSANLTRAFSYMSFVWGVACLILYPMAGHLGDLFGSLHAAYGIAYACCAVSGVALCVLVWVHKRGQRRLHQQAIRYGCKGW